MFIESAKDLALPILPTRILTRTHDPRLDTYVTLVCVFDASKLMSIKLDDGVPTLPRTLQVIDSNLVV